MAEISHENRLEVARLYLRGNTYKEIETETGLSHGSISNIVNKLLSGQLVIPGVPSDEVSDLHQLSVDLKKKGLEPSQALLGLNLVIYSFNGRSGINSQCLKESGYSRSRSDNSRRKVVEPLQSDLC